MNTIGAILGIAALVLIVLAKLPGIQLVVEPIIAGFFAIVRVVMEGLWGWSVYGLKALGSAHFELVRHLLLSPESIDPTFAVKEQTAD